MLSCADDANLCEVIDINVGDDTQNEFVHTVLENNRFDTMYRKQLERMSAAGTVAAYVRLDNAVYLSNGKAIGGEIRLTHRYLPVALDAQIDVFYLFSAEHIRIVVVFNKFLISFKLIYNYER